MQLGMDKKNSMDEQLEDDIKEGTGMHSSDPEIFSVEKLLHEKQLADNLEFTNDNNYITFLHNRAEKLRLFDTLQYPAYQNYTGKILISSGRIPFLWTENLSKGHVLFWVSDERMKTRILGPLGGLDDCLWRSMA